MPTMTPRPFGFIFLASVLLYTTAAIASAGQGKLVAVDSNHVAIQGYDAVAYFTDGKAVKGSSKFEYVFDDATWRFSNATHRGMFIADPDRYMPQYGGFCASCIATKSCTEFGDPESADPEAWAIVDGKLYMVSSKKLLEQWRANSAKNIKQADARWPAIQQHHTAQHQ